MARIDGVLCCGNAVWDVIARSVDSVRFGATAWIDTIEQHLGGNGANTSYALGKLGVPVRLLSYVGKDDAGTRVRDMLQSVGVDISALRVSEQHTPASVVLVKSDGSRAFLHRPGASLTAFDEALTFTPDLLRGMTRFHLANVFGLLAFRKHAAGTLCRAKAAGLQTSLDTGWDSRGEWMTVLGPCLPHVDLLFVNEDEARELTGHADPLAAARALQNYGPATVVVKLGSRGCLLLYQEPQWIPAYKVNALDSTGAGDAFSAGYLAALQYGYTAVAAARFANAAGALSVEAVGAVTGLRSFNETLAWMTAHQENCVPGIMQQDPPNNVPFTGAA